MNGSSYITPHGIEVTCAVSQINFRRGLWRLLRDLDEYRGVYLSSGYEYPGRYSRWDIASARPPLEIVSYDRRVEFRPLNERGRLIADMLVPVLAGHPHWEEFGLQSGILAGRLKPMPALFPEEQRSSVRSALVFNMKAIVAQKLLPSIKPGVPRVPTVEIMTFNPTVRKLILDAQDDKLGDAIRIGKQEGMQDFTMSLRDLVNESMIDRPTAFEVAPNPEALKMALKGIEVRASAIL